MRDWVIGRRYPTSQGGQFTPPLIELPDPLAHLLSFTNLVEAYVLASLRRRQLVLKPDLQRIEYDASGLAVRFFPVRRTADGESPRTVVIDPFLSFGKPVLAGTGISTGIIFHRFDTGEAIADLADDYGLSPGQIEEAIRYELPFPRRPAGR